MDDPNTTAEHIETTLLEIADMRARLLPPLSLLEAEVLAIKLRLRLVAGAVPAEVISFPIRGGRAS